MTQNVLQTLPLTLVVAARNCEDRIEGTLTPWLRCVSEIIVVDEESSDKTAEVAQSLGAKVMIQAAPGGNFDRNRKAGILEARFPWVLYLDTDERPSPELILEIKSFFENEKSLASVSGVKISNEFYFLGKKLNHGIYNAKSAEIRLFKKDAFSYPCEEGFHRGVSVSGQVHRFKNSYRHFNVNSLSEWFIKTNQYTEADAQAFQGTSERPLKLIWKAYLFFLKHYIWKQGFRDGVHGFLACTYFSLYHFTLGFKIWEKSFLRTKELEIDFLKPIPLTKR